MVVRRDGRHNNKMGKKIVRTVAAGMVVVPGFFGGQLALTDNLVSADSNVLILEAIPEAPITLYNGQIVYFDEIIQQNQLYEQYRVSSYHIDHGSSESAYLVAGKPGTYTVYLYDSYDNYQYTLEAYATFDVVVPYPDANNDGLIDISDIVKYLAVHEYNSETSTDMLGWIDSSHKAVNVAPTVNSAVIFDPSVYLYCTNSYSLEPLFSDENTSSLNYSIVGNMPENMKAIITGGLYFDYSTCQDVWGDVIKYTVNEYGTSTITVRATDEYGEFVDRDIVFDVYETIYYSGYAVDIGWAFTMGESEDIVNISATVVDNPPKDIGEFVNPDVFNDGSIFLRFDNVEFVDGNAKGLIRVDVTTEITNEPGHTYTQYFRIMGFEDQPG
jgi:hypothetical protein